MAILAVNAQTYEVIIPVISPGCGTGLALILMGFHQNQSSLKISLAGLQDLPLFFAASLLLIFLFQSSPVIAGEADSWKSGALQEAQILQLSNRINNELGRDENSPRKRLHRYRVILDKELAQARVNVCFDGKAPDYLMVDYRKGTEYLLEFPRTDGGEIEFLGRYWRTGELRANACLEYLSDLTPYRHNKINRRKQGNKLLYFSDNNWLWLPEKVGADEQVLIEFQLPKGMEISAPWYRVRSAKNWFVPSNNPHDWGFSMVIGQFTQEFVPIKGGSQLNIAFLSGLQQRPRLKRWVADTANSLGQYLGRFPTAQTQIVMIQSQRFRGGPVPWGEVKRGGGLGILFVVNSQMPITDFYKDWTASHEFSHLLLPKIDYQDSWLSEGLASYLQYILMAKSGQISAQTAWQDLLEGFERGNRGTLSAPTEKLKDTVDNRSRGGRSGRTMRIYWSGAAYFFKADVMLRLRSHNKLTLATVLARFNSCCGDSAIEWKGRALAEKLDQLSDSRVFTSLYLSMSESEHFPPLEKELATLGLQWNGEQLSYVAKNNPIREDIMARF